MQVTTHDGHFHADDVTAYTILRMAFDSLSLSRSRDPAVWKESDIVFDVGGEYAPEHALYDHHMNSPPLRPNGKPHSSAGLIWRAYGHQALRKSGYTGNATDWVWGDIDRQLMSDLDAADNMGGPARGAGFISALIESFNPVWNDIQDFDKRFLEASDYAHGILKRYFDQSAAEFQAAGLVESALKNAEDSRFIILDRNMPWQKPLLRLNSPETLYVVHPDETAQKWLVHGVPVQEGAFDVRKPLPENWAGLDGEKFAQAAGLDDAVFCHPRRFVCGARSMRSACLLAQAALQNG